MKVEQLLSEQLGPCIVKVYGESKGQRPRRKQLAAVAMLLGVSMAKEKLAAQPCLPSGSVRAE